MTGFGIFLFSGDNVGPIPNRWCIGWLTGRDCDLVCVKRTKEPYEAEMALSPISTNLFIAFIGFVLKRILVIIDNNCCNP